MTQSNADRAPHGPQGRPDTAVRVRAWTTSSAKETGRPPASMRAAGSGRRLGWCLAALVIALDAVLVGPLIGHGDLHLLDVGDYPQGPHPAFAPSAFGLPPGITNRAPVEAALYWVFQTVHWAPVRLLPFAAVAPLACVGFSRIFHGRGLAVGMATVLFTVNPFIYERMANGQLYVVMGYSLLPVLLALIVRPLSSLVATAVLGGLTFSVDVALSVHYLFIAGLLIVMTGLAHQGLHQTRSARAAGGIAVCGAVLNLYWLIPATWANRTMQSHVTHLDLSVFQTLGDPTWGLVVNVAGLFGFWRPGPPLVKNYVSGWPFLLLAILIIAGFGLVEMFRRGGPAGRAITLSCAAVVIVGGLLALGAQGPTGVLYTWLFNHLPGFKVMREPEKFSGLLALGYATCFGSGAEVMARSLTRNFPRLVCGCCLATLVLGYGFTELWGFDGYARPSMYPASWAAADRAMPPGARALVLPWRSYLRVVWARNQVVANPMQGYFDRPVISADDLEAGPIETETSNPRSLFLQFCFSEGGRLTEFGRLLAPLGIRYVILTKVPGAQSFDWLNRQHDLTRVFNSATVAVFENKEAVPTAYEPNHILSLRDWGQVLALAQRTSLLDYLIYVRNARPGPLHMPEAAAVRRSRPFWPLKATGGTPAYQPIDLPARTRTVVLTNPAYAGWDLAGFHTTSQFGVTVAFTDSRGMTHSGRLVATYGPWRLVNTWDIAGLCLTLAALALLLTTALIRSSSWPGTSSGKTHGIGKVVCDLGLIGEGRSVPGSGRG